MEAGRAEFQAAGLGDLLEQMAQREPLGRVGVPDDVARVALFCASDLAMLMTGSTLLVQTPATSQCNTTRTAQPTP